MQFGCRGEFLMPSAQMEFDKENENLIRQIQKLQERVDQLERHALTSNNIKAERIIVANSKDSFGDMANGQVTIGQVLQLLNTADKGPGSGKGLELYYSDTYDTGRVQGYDRDGANYENVEVNANQIDLNSGSSAVVTRIRLSPAGMIQMHLDGVDATRRMENNDSYAHNDVLYHFDGSDYPMSAWTWQTYTPFQVPTGISSEAKSRVNWSLDKGTGNWQAFYARSLAYNSMGFIPYFSNSSNPLYVGVRWDDGTNNNYVTLFWASLYSTYPYTGLYLESRAGGGSPVTNQLLDTFPAGAKVPFVRAAVEGTQWTNWSIRPFVEGWTMRRWLTSHGGKTWTPTRSGIWLYNNSGSNTSWQYFGFDAFHAY